MPTSFLAHTKPVNWRQQLWLLPVLLLTAGAFIVASFTFATLESGYLTVSLIALLSMYLYRRHTDFNLSWQLRILLDSAAVLFGTLAITSVFDGLDISLIGRGNDGETGLLAGLAISMVIAARRNDRSPAVEDAALSSAFWAIALLFVGFAPQILTRYSFRSDQPAIIHVWQIVMLLALFLPVRRQLSLFSPATRLFLTYGAGYIIMTAAYSGTGANPVARLCAGIACMLLLATCTPCRGAERAGSALAIRFGTGIALFAAVGGGLVPLIVRSNEIRIMAGFMLLILPPMVFLIRHLGRITVATNWTALLLMWLVSFSFAVANANSPGLKVAVQNYFPMLFVVIASLHLLLRIYFKERPVWFSGQRSFTGMSPGSAVNFCMMAVTALIIILTTAIPINLLIENKSPSRLLAELHGTPLWPGLPLFITMAMHDEYYYYDRVPWKMPRSKDPFLLINDLRKGTPDRFSYYNDVQDVDKYRWASAPGVKNTRKPGILGMELYMEGESYLVRAVHRASPAGRAGVKRGDHLVAVDGVPIDTSTGKYPLLESAVGDKVRLTLQNSKGVEREVPLAYVENTQDTPILRLIPAGPGPVGYLYISSFDSESLYGVEREFAKLRKAGVRDLVLDLRFNPGGEVEDEIKIASYLAGRRNAGKLLSRNSFNRKYRDKNDEDNLLDIPVALDLQRLVVITSGLTCSASESIINDLKPYLNVKTVGRKTCGKPMSMDPFFIGGKNNGSALNIITAVAQNSRKEGEYFDGIKPDCPAKNDEHYELGDPREAMTAEALHLLETGKCLTKEQR